MKNLILIPLFLMSLAIYSQGNRPIFQDLALIPASILDENGAFKVNWQANTIQYESQGFRPYQIESIKIVGTDLSVQLKANKLYKEELNYHLSLMVEDTYGIRLKPSPSDRSTTNSFDFTWEGFTENILPTERDYSIFLQTEITGSICDEAPNFEFKEKLPYILAGLGGAGFIIGGQLTNRSMLANYENYENTWLTGGSQSDAIAFEKIEQQEQDYKTLTLIGGSVLVVDLVMYLLGPNRKFNKEKRLYGAYCVEQKKIEFHPTLNSSKGFGYQIQINF